MPTPIVLGFDKGICKRPKGYLFDSWKRRPEFCGGYAYRTVKKIDVMVSPVIQEGAVRVIGIFHSVFR